MTVKCKYLLVIYKPEIKERIAFVSNQYISCVERIANIRLTLTGK